MKTSIFKSLTWVLPVAGLFLVAACGGKGSNSSINLANLNIDIQSASIIEPAANATNVCPSPYFKIRLHEGIEICNASLDAFDQDISDIVSVYRWDQDPSQGVPLTGITRQPANGGKDCDISFTVGGGQGLSLSAYYNVQVLGEFAGKDVSTALSTFSTGPSGTQCPGLHFIAEDAPAFPSSLKDTSIDTFGEDTNNDGLSDEDFDLDAFDIVAEIGSSYVLGLAFGLKSIPNNILQQGLFKINFNSNVDEDSLTNGIALYRVTVGEEGATKLSERVTNMPLPKHYVQNGIKQLDTVQVVFPAQGLPSGKYILLASQNLQSAKRKLESSRYTYFLVP
jgi:hypothetical protein